MNIIKVLKFILSSEHSHFISVDKNVYEKWKYPIILAVKLNKNYKSVEIFRKKFKVLEDIIKSEVPEIFCVVEGTISKEDTRLKELFETYNYVVYFEPEFVNKDLYKNLFEFKTYDSYGLKIFIKKD